MATVGGIPSAAQSAYITPRRRRYLTLLALEVLKVLRVVDNTHQIGVAESHLQHVDRSDIGYRAWGLEPWRYGGKMMFLPQISRRLGARDRKSVCAAGSLFEHLHLH